MGAALVFLAVAGSAVAADTGQSLYNDNCSACHQKTGLGVKGAFPALAGDKLVKGPAPLLVTTVLNGRGGMPAFKSDLTDAQLAQVLTYIRAAWGNKAAPVTGADIAAGRRKTSAVAQPKNLQAH
jgi:mono/diheme cytochrome c family protein